MIPLKSDVNSGYLPVVTCTLIAINVLGFLLVLVSGNSAQAMFVAWGFIPAELFARPMVEAPTLFSSMFLHAGPAHLLGNMWFLFLFGDNIEHRLGRGRFLGFYLASGLVAALAHAVLAPASTIPCIGASGAVSGVMGAYALLHPKAEIKTFFLIVFRPYFVNIPALVFVGFWFIGQLFWGLVYLGSTGGGVAWWAHIGGCLTGVGAALWVLNRERNPAPAPKRRPFPPPRPEPARRPRPAPRPPLPPRYQPGQQPPWADNP